MLKKFFKYLKWGFYLIIANTFLKFEYFFYYLFKKIFKPQKKKRLFLTSGNISLINVLTIIEQLGEEDVEDYLVIDTVQGTKEFIDINKKIAQMFNFKKIYCCNESFALFELVKHNIFKVDELYSHTHYRYIQCIYPIYNKCKYYIFDEGVGSLFAQPHKNYKKISGLFLHRYLDKLDYLGWNEFKITNIDESIFKKFAKKISLSYPFDIDIPKESKTIIFCGSYWKQFKFTKEEYYCFEREIMTKLINLGYNVIYKKHPRETEACNIPVEASVTNCLLPLDIYNLNVIGIVSISSSISIQSYHHWKIPGFHCVDDKMLSQRNYKSIFDTMHTANEEYSLSVNTLFELNPQKFSEQDLLTLLQTKFQNHLNSLPLLSENPLIKKQYQIYTNKYLKENSN